MKSLVTVLGSSLAAGMLVCSAPAQAFTQPVMFNLLQASGTVQTPLGVDDSLFVDTLVTTEVGALLQQVTFTVASGVSMLEGSAVWQISTATGAGPRLVGVNIDILDAGNNVVLSDTFAGVLAGYAHSTLTGPIGPGTYTLRATGNGVRDSSLDISITMAVPEPSTWALMLGGGLGMCWLAARRRQG
ncbi:PEP-CTERM sorting domain-containing protein [Aquincola tertiaricarbonis]|uniref:PEP-CTERM sorting domain-containing protein n=1 Tax=Aquincola tertiaricarbonis TaxID=391953 RepID=UPI000614D9F3|nr:PEP-CTERM sorting domain-containing protein [Aquincola tertiaricarbonis]